jgi:hypothetical protein
VAVAHQALVTILGALIGVLGEEARYLRLDSLGEQRSRAIAQNLGQTIGKATIM